MSAELVLEAHRRHLNNSNDRDARDAFLREAINFFAKTPESECILHHPETPDIHVELLGYFSPKNFIEEPVKSILNKLGRQLSTCFDCLHYYYQAKLQFRSRWGSQFTPETLRQLFDRIHNWDLERQHATLSSFQTQYDLKSDTITAPEFRKLRKKIFCVLEEIFRFPESLQNRTLDALWVKVLLTLISGKHTSPLQINTSTVDAGALVVVGHANADLRGWAQRSLQTAKARLYLTEADEVTLSTLTDYLIRLNPHTDEHHTATFNYTDDQAALWMGFSAILSAIDWHSASEYEVLRTIETRAGVDIGILVRTRLPVAKEDFWPVLTMFADLVEARPATILNSLPLEQRNLVIRGIFENESFRQRSRKGGSWPAEFSFRWLSFWIESCAFGDATGSNSDFVLSYVLEESKQWQNSARAALFTTVSDILRKHFLRKSSVVSSKTACNAMNSLLTIGGPLDAQTVKQLLDLLILTAAMGGENASNSAFVEEAMSYLSRILCEMVDLGSVDWELWQTVFTVIHCTAHNTNSWARNGVGALTIQKVRKGALAAAELALGILPPPRATDFPKIRSNFFAVSAKSFVTCLYGADEITQEVAFTLIIELLSLQRNLHQPIPPDVAQVFRKLTDEDQGALSSSQIESLKSRLPLTESEALRIARASEAAKSKTPVPSVVDLTSDGPDDVDVIVRSASKAPRQQALNFESPRAGQITVEKSTSVITVEDIPVPSSGAPSQAVDSSFKTVPNAARFTPKPPERNVDKRRNGQSSLDTFVSRDEDVRSAWEKLAGDIAAKPTPTASRGQGYAFGRKPLQPAEPKKLSKLQQLREEMKEDKAPSARKSKKEGTPPSGVVVPPPNRPLNLPYQRNMPEVTIIARDPDSFGTSASRPKSTTQMINRQGVAAKPVSRGIPIRTPGDNRPQALRQLSTLNKIVLQWNYDMEGEKPPDFPFDLKNIPNTFQGGEQEYVSVFEPLLVLECWEQMQKSKYEVDRGDALTFKLTNVQTVDVFHDLTFTAPGKQMRLRGYSEHDVLNVTDVEVPRQGHESTSGKSFLAKITNVSFKADEGIVIARVYMSVNAALAPRLRAGAKFSLLSTFSMTTSIREYGTLCALPSLCLLKDVLRPGKIRKFHPRPDDVRLMMTRYNLNEPQAAAISGAVAQSTGFTLIQGPPGTGKTKTIVGLISALLTRENVVKVPGQAVTPNSKHRLLCCAPSNAAIDEIVRRLKEGIPHPRGGTFVPRVVRIGTTESIHTSVRDVTLEAILEGILATTGNFQEDDRMADIRSAITSLKDERERLRAREDDNEIEAEEASKVDAKISTITKKLAALHEQLQRERQEKTAASQARDKYRRQQKLKVLMEADVILSTLSGAGSDVLGDLHELTFPIVIVDEAAQSVELSTLIPLRYGAKQCILVGDPQQLPPTVLSQVGQSYSYEQSLFQRLMNNDPDGTHLLSISYRMHPSISSYVSKGFYKGRLRDAPNMSELCTAPWHKDSMFAPYQLIDMYNGREQTGRGHSYFNLDEARLAVDLVEVLCSRFPDYNFAGKIGIITFYKKQVREIKNTFIRKGWTREMMQNIDVNTVDGFQGQEKEIIILSCVRANGSVGFTSDIRRMNVALSRAKYSLIILGNLETLKRNRAWRDLIEDAAGRRMIKSWTERLSRLRDEVRGRPGNMLPRVEAPQGDGANDGERKTERKRERSDEQGSDTGKAGRKRKNTPQSSSSSDQKRARR